MTDEKKPYIILRGPTWEMTELSDGRVVPTRCVQALHDFEKIWPGATFPTARAGIVAAVLAAYEEVQR